MTKLGDTREHYWLMLGMARARGVDLGQAMKVGRLSAPDYAEMVTACRSCTQPGACRKLLDSHALLATGPGYCVNQDKLSALAE